MMAWGTNYDYFLGIGDYDYAETPQDFTIDLYGEHIPGSSIAL